MAMPRGYREGAQHDFAFVDSIADSPKRVQARIDDANELIEKTPQLEETITPAARMFYYAKSTMAEVEEGRGAVDTLQLAKKIERMNAQEQWYRRCRQMPTVGIEIEVPVEFLDTSDVALLEQLEIPGEYEDPSDLYEVNPVYTYSPWPQARIVQSLAELNMLPIARDGKIREDKTLSLHINFGVPKELSEHDDLGFDMSKLPESYLLANAMAIGFGPTRRLAERKTIHMLHYKNDAKESSKNRVYNEDEEFASSAMRFEVRATEFRDFPTYRLLAEGQLVAAAMFASFEVEHIKYVYNETEQMALAWKECESTIKQHLHEADIQLRDIDGRSEDVWNVIGSMKNTNIQNEMRKAIHNCAQKVSTILEIPTSFSNR